MVEGMYKVMDTEAVLDALERSPGPVEQLTFDEIAAMPAERSFDRPRSTPSSRAARPAAAKPTAEIVTGRHQDVRLYLAILFKTFAELTDAGLVREAPFQVRLSKTSVYEPDIVVIGSGSLDRVGDTSLDGPPDVVVEVLSQETTAVDRGDKFVAYEAAGVREYWLIDPLRDLVNLYQLGPDGRFDEVRPDTSGRFRSRVLKGFVLDTSLLWRRILPTIVETVDTVQGMLAQR
jgi:Uma2 family endonuclease